MAQDCAWAEGRGGVSIAPRAPREWGNIESPIRVSVESLNHHVHELPNARYDFAQRAFISSQGERISDAMLDEWSVGSRGIRGSVRGRGGVSLMRWV